MNAEQPAVARRGRADDIDAILDLLAEYDLPRAYFEPFYRADPTYRPEHSWVVEQAGHLVAHVRVFDRDLRCGQAGLRVAGVGNVITARAHRGRGYAGRVLQAMLADTALDGFPYSLLGTDIPGLYERFGFAIIEQATARAVLTPPPADLSSATTAVFQSSDLAEVMRLYERTNAGRTGPTIRSPEYWRGQLEWLHEDRDGFLLARRDDRRLQGYVRSRATHAEVEILELAVVPEDAPSVGRQLLGQVAERRRGSIQTRVPPALLDVLHPDEREVDFDMGLMGRIVNLEAFLRALQPELIRRLRAAPSPDGVCRIASSAGTAELRVSHGQLVAGVQPTTDLAGCLNDFELGHLLFHGYDDKAAELFDGRSDTDLLQALFPAQEFVLWPADAF